MATCSYMESHSSKLFLTYYMCKTETFLLIHNSNFLFKYEPGAKVSGYTFAKKKRPELIRPLYVLHVLKLNFCVPVLWSSCYSCTMFCLIRPRMRLHFLDRKLCTLEYVCNISSRVSLHLCKKCIWYIYFL